MKIVIGVDTEGHYRNTLNLAARIKFADPSWYLAHSVEAILPMTGLMIPSDAALNVEFAQLAQTAGEHAVERAMEDVRALGMTADTALLGPSAADALATYADEIHAELVGVHSNRKGILGSLFLGSVSRGLAIGARQSLLISKGEIDPSGGLSVVFATDHSEYAQKALDCFIAMDAKGIEKITVVTALDVDAAVDAVYPLVVDSYQAESLSQTEAVAQKLRQAGYACAAVTDDGPVSEAIDKAMKANQADLLIMGAQGHGFMHRVLLGSKALHQVVAGPHSLLIVRP